jgi:hypothetical protein
VGRVSARRSFGHLPTPRLASFETDDADGVAIIHAMAARSKFLKVWSEIGAMLGVSKQAAQRKYAAKISA